MPHWQASATRLGVDVEVMANQFPLGETSQVDAPGPVDEGSSVTLNATATGSATFAWDLYNDGQFDDATGASTGFSGIDGPSVQNITVQATVPKNVFWDFENATSVGSISTSAGTPAGTGVSGIASQNRGGPAENFRGSAGSNPVGVIGFHHPKRDPWLSQGSLLR